MSETWFEYFKQSMDSVGMPVPSGLFEDTVTAVTTIRSIQAGLALGGDVTIAELVGAGTLSDAFTAVGAVLASVYVGAAIGACIYATACKAEDFLSVSGAGDVDLSGVDVGHFKSHGAAVAAGSGTQAG